MNDIENDLQIDDETRNDIYKTIKIFKSMLTKLPPKRKGEKFTEEELTARNNRRFFLDFLSDVYVDCGLIDRDEPTSKLLTELTYDIVINKVIEAVETLVFYDVKSLKLDDASVEIISGRK
jgi:hypothetical protein